MNSIQTDNGTRIPLRSVAFKRLAPDADGDFIKEILQGLTPEPTNLSGLGFEVIRSSRNKAEIDLNLASRLEGKSQIKADWRKRLKIAAAISRLNLDAREIGNSQNLEKIEYLKSISKPGDVIFVTGGGKHQSAFAELIDIGMRLVNGKRSSDLSFPFTHVMVNLGNGKIIELTPAGKRIRTWEEVFIQNKYYDCIAVANLEGTEQDRKSFIEKLNEFSEKHPKYNLSWTLFQATFQIRDKDKHNDSSVKGNKAVCTDYVTEPAKILAQDIPHLAALQYGKNPLELFINPKLRIKAAVNLIRN